MSESMIGFHWSSRYCVRSVFTVVASSGTLPGRISGEASFDAHSSCTIEETNRHGATGVDIDPNPVAISTAGSPLRRVISTG